MSKANKIILTCASVLTAGFISTAQAADDVVLFKIHDIAPVTNTDGLTVACEFGATFYNRTGENISNVDMHLTWHDETMDTINLDGEKNEDGNFSDDKRDADVSMDLKLPPLKAYQQISLKSKINTDKCFLLLGDVMMNLTSCKKGEGEVSSGEDVCRDVFQYVSAQNPEYYTEFQAISLNEQKVQEASQKATEQQEINDMFNKSVDAINSISANLN